MTEIDRLFSHATHFKMKLLIYLFHPQPNKPPAHLLNSEYQRGQSAYR